MLCRGLGVEITQLVGGKDGGTLAVKDFALWALCCHTLARKLGWLVHDSRADTRQVVFRAVKAILSRPCCFALQVRAPHYCLSIHRVSIGIVVVCCLLVLVWGHAVKVEGRRLQVGAS